MQGFVLINKKTLKPVYKYIRIKPEVNLLVEQEVILAFTRRETAQSYLDWNQIQNDKPGEEYFVQERTIQGLVFIWG